MKLTHSDLLEVRKSPGKGRGVFARKDIKKGTTFEVVPLIVFDNDECEGAKMATYVFEWTKKTSAIALGYGSLYNHSFQPNARYYDGKNDTKEFVSLQDIKAGEEITVNYNGNPKKQDKVDFNVIENGAGHVANGKAPSRNGKAVSGKAVNGTATNGVAVNGHKVVRTAVKKKPAERKKTRAAASRG
ncbi:MAG TPA: SET domain-containing protein [Caulifigura sp.]|nr:SET domain-containing protein [Caulifigura sp.]